MTPLTWVNGAGCVAVRYGLEEAVFLNSIMFWWRTNKSEGHNFRDGRWWTHNSLTTLKNIFPWWSLRQLRRVITSCKEQGALLTGEYNEDRRDRTVWYSPGDELLELYGEDQTDNRACQDGQVQMPEPTQTDVNSDKCVYKEDHVVTHVVTTPPVSPQGDGGAEDKPKKDKLRLDETARKLLSDYVTGDRELGQAMYALMEVRAAKKAVNTPRAVVTLLNQIDRLSEGDRDTKLLLVQQSVANSWKSVFPLRGGPPPRGGSGPGGWAPDPEVI